MFLSVLSVIIDLVVQMKRRLVQIYTRHLTVLRSRSPLSIVPVERPIDYRSHIAHMQTMLLCFRKLNVFFLPFWHHWFPLISVQYLMICTSVIHHSLHIVCITSCQNWSPTNTFVWLILWSNFPLSHIWSVYMSVDIICQSNRCEVYFCILYPVYIVVPIL